MEIKITMEKFEVEVEMISQLTGIVYHQYETLVERKYFNTDDAYIQMCHELLDYCHKELNGGEKDV